MAEQDNQKELLEKLAKSDVKLTGEAAEKTKENIQNDKGGGSYLGVGVHEVYIEGIELFEAKSGTLGLRINVENEDGKNDATFWLSEAALPYSIENISRLVVHNTPEADKATARNFMSNITSGKELFEIAQKKLDGGIAYLSVRESKTQTYTDKNGEIKPSLEKNLLSYKPKAEPQQAVAKAMGGAEKVSEEIDLNEIPF